MLRAFYTFQFCIYNDKITDQNIMKDKHEKLHYTSKKDNENIIAFRVLRQHSLKDLFWSDLRAVSHALWMPIYWYFLAERKIGCKIYFPQEIISILDYLLFSSLPPPVIKLCRETFHSWELTTTFEQSTFLSSFRKRNFHLTSLHCQ